MYKLFLIKPDGITAKDLWKLKTKRSAVDARRLIKNQDQPGLTFPSAKGKQQSIRISNLQTVFKI